MISTSRGCNISTGENRGWLLIGPFWNGVSYIDLAPDSDTDLRIEDL